MIRKIVYTLLVFSSQICFSQTTDWKNKERIKEYATAIDEKNLDEALLGDALLYELNKELLNQEVAILQPEELLSFAAKDYVLIMTKAEEAKPELGGKKGRLSFRMIAHGGSGNGSTELLAKIAAKDGKTGVSYQKAANDAVFSWFNNVKTAAILKSGQWIFAGFSGQLDGTGKKMYISLVMGNYSIYNKGAAAVKTSGMSISTSTQGLLPYDAKICKGVDNYKAIDALRNGVTIVKDTIFFETTEFKSVKKLLKNPTDGLAVDLVKYSQYACETDNIIDNNYITRGWVSKKMMQPKLLKKNLYGEKEAKSKMKVALAMKPQDFTNDFEIGLVLIQDKHLCKVVRPSFAEQIEIKGRSKNGILGDTVTIFNTYSYKPEPDTTILKFRVPFQLGKSDYKTEDIKPFIDALNEPDFKVLSLKITAFSSIEGEEEKNMRLREVRAQNIVMAIKKMQHDSISTQISNSDSWDLFYTDIAKTSFDSLKTKTKDQIRALLEKESYKKKLESVFNRHRFALVEMRIVHDLSDVKNEQFFVLKKYQEALDSSDLVKALAIQKFIMKKARRKIYSDQIIERMTIPADSARFAGMQMNRLWLDYIVHDRSPDSAFYNEVSRLYKLDPKNEYILFNKVYCEVKLLDLTEEAQIGEIQQRIDALRVSNLRREEVDPMNIEFQVKILQSIGNTLKPANEDQLAALTLEKIKQIVDVKNSDSKSALKLAALFMERRDYGFAIMLLEPFIKNDNADENIVFTYLSACSHLPIKMHTGVFDHAIKIAYKLNMRRLCGLFSDHAFSITVFENPKTKDFYCEKCK